MFDINPSELAIIALLALILVGPSRLPEVARNAARWLRAARSLFADVRARVREEVGEDPLVQEISQLNLRGRGGAAGLVGQLIADDPAGPAAGASPGAGTGKAAVPPRPGGQPADQGKHWDSEAT